LAHMSISTYFRPNIHQNGPKILGVNTKEKPSQNQKTKTKQRTTSIYVSG
jgi:hypothetical protein